MYITIILNALKMPPYRLSDTVYLHNLIKIMEHHMYKQLFLHQCEMYIVVSHSKHVAELQMHWKDYLTDTWCYTRFPFEFNGTNALTIYINKIVKFFNTVLFYATPFGDSPFAEALL